MKNLFVAILVAFAMSASSGSFAASYIATGNGQAKEAVSGAVAFAIDQSKVEVIVQAAATPKLIIRIKDFAGKTIATKTLSQAEAGARVRFDLSQLPDGLYRVTVWDGKNSEGKQIELKTASPTVTVQELHFV